MAAKRGLWVCLKKRALGVPVRRWRGHIGVDSTTPTPSFRLSRRQEAWWLLSGDVDALRARVARYLALSQAAARS